LYVKKIKNEKNMVIDGSWIIGLISALCADTGMQLAMLSID
jgi:hypothetical protein